MHRRYLLGIQLSFLLEAIREHPGHSRWDLACSGGGGGGGAAGANGYFCQPTLTDYTTNVVLRSGPS